MKLVVGALRPNGVGNLDIELMAPDGSKLPAFEPGAHVDVATAHGFVRQCSLYNRPDERDRYHLCVRLEERSRGGSASVHADLLIGSEIDVSIPRNLFRPPTARRRPSLEARQHDSEKRFWRRRPVRYGPRMRSIRRRSGDPR
jgi:ferredoxin-NADP reductase